MISPRKLWLLLAVAAVTLPLVGWWVWRALGLGSHHGPPTPPVVHDVLGPKKITPKVVGWAHLVLLADDGSLWGLGSNLEGQLGDHPKGPGVVFPHLRRLHDGTNWVDVAALHGTTLAIREDGTLWQWGTPPGGVPVQGVQQPTRVGQDTDWAGVHGSLLHVVAVRQDGSLWTWGGWLDSATNSSFILHPVPIPIRRPDRWKSVALRNSVNMGVSDDGTLWMWGSVTVRDPTNPQVRIRLVETNPFQISLDRDWVRVESRWDGVIGERQDGSLSFLAFEQLATRTNWVRLPDVPNGRRAWFGLASVTLAVDQLGRVWISGPASMNNWMDPAISRTLSETNWVRLPEGGGAILAAGGFQAIGLWSDRDELYLWGSRLDDPGKPIRHVLDGPRTFLSQYLPIDPPPYRGMRKAVAPRPWKAAVFTRTNAPLAAP